MPEATARPSSFSLIRLWLLAGPLWISLLLIALAPETALGVPVGLALPILLWPRIAAVVPALERSWLGLVLGGGGAIPLLVIPGSVLAMVFPAMRMSEAGHTSMGAEGIGLVLVWLSLCVSGFFAFLLPRILVPPLRPGAFSGGVTSRRARIGVWLLLWLSFGLVLSTGSCLYRSHREAGIHETCRRDTGASHRPRVVADASERPDDAPWEQGEWLELSVDPRSGKLDDGPLPDGRRFGRIVSVWFRGERIRQLHVQKRGLGWRRITTYCFDDAERLIRHETYFGSSKRQAFLDRGGRVIGLRDEISEEIPRYHRPQDAPFHTLLDAVRRGEGPPLRPRSGG